MNEIIAEKVAILVGGIFIGIMISAVYGAYIDAKEKHKKWENEQFKSEIFSELKRGKK